MQPIAVAAGKDRNIGLVRTLIVAGGFHAQVGTGKRRALHRQACRKHLLLGFMGPVRLERLAEHRFDLRLLRTEQFGEDFGV